MFSRLVGSDLGVLRWYCHIPGIPMKKNCQSGPLSWSIVLEIFYKIGLTCDRGDDDDFSFGPLSVNSVLHWLCHDPT